MSYQPYPSNLADEEWNWINPYIPKQKKVGRPRTSNMRSICDAIYYHLKTGCQWHYFPHDFPPYQTVYYYYRRWQRKGIWQSLNQVLREKCRQKMGKAK